MKPQQEVMLPWIVEVVVEVGSSRWIQDIFQNYQQFADGSDEKYQRKERGQQGCQVNQYNYLENDGYLLMMMERVKKK